MSIKNSFNFFSNLYYKRSVLPYLLLPISWLFGLITLIRKHAYKKGWFKSTKVSVPVIVVGNITLGGTGKTPLVIYLVELLKKEGYRPGVISRGYGGKAAYYPFKVDGQSTTNSVGDEPILIFQRTQVPVVVDPNRPRAAQYLVEKENCNLIISDDGLQHYALRRDIEIAVIDGVRGFGNGFLFPAGPLREPRSRLSEVDFVVSNSAMNAGNLGIKSKLKSQWVMKFEPEELINLKSSNVTSTDLKLKAPNNNIIAVAGIGNPQRFFDTLASMDFKFLKHPMPDHYPFSKLDFEQFEGEEESTSPIFIMTEKDAVKCRSFATDNMWYLPIKARFSDDFDDTILEKIQNA